MTIKMLCRECGKNRLVSQVSHLCWSCYKKKESENGDISADLPNRDAISSHKGAWVLRTPPETSLKKSRVFEIIAGCIMFVFIFASGFQKDTSLTFLAGILLFPAIKLLGGN